MIVSGYLIGHETDSATRPAATCGDCEFDGDSTVMSCSCLNSADEWTDSEIDLSKSLPPVLCLTISDHHPGRHWLAMLVRRRRRGGARRSHLLQGDG